MSNQIQITGGAKVRNLNGVLTGTSGVVSSVPLGAANGVATLDSSGKVPLSQLPSSVITYLGTWNAATNTPTLVNGTGDDGDLYICNVAGTVNFGAGPITFYVGDWVIYGSGTWQRSSGATGTVTSVGLTSTAGAFTISNSPITTSGNIGLNFAGNSGQYVAGNGSLVTFPTKIDEAKRFVTEVYNETGATLTKGTVVYINGGHGNLPTVTKAQADTELHSYQTYGLVQTDITNMNNGYVVVAGSIADLDTSAYSDGTTLYLSPTTAGGYTSTKPTSPDHIIYIGIVVRAHPTQGVIEVKIQNTQELSESSDVLITSPANNDGLFYDGATSLWKNKTIATVLGYTPLGGSGTAGNVPYYTAANTLGSENGFMYDSSTNRFGVNTTVPNATIGANASIDSGYSLLLKNADANYNGLGFGLDSTYGNLITTQKIGTAAARNFTLQNQSGYVSIDESGNFGVNILTPKGGVDIYNSTTAALYLHNSASGVAATDGVRLSLNSTNANLRNYESGTLSMTSEGDFSIITAATENFRVNSADGSIYQSKVANAMLKSVSGVITAAVAGTDYLAASAISGTTNYVPKFATSSTIGNSLLYSDTYGIGINTSSPQVQGYGLDIYGANGNATLFLHSNSTLTSTVHGTKLIQATDNNFGLVNYDGAITINAIGGDLALLTAGTVNFKIIQSSGAIYQSNITSAIIKADSGGVLTAAVAGTDYVAPSALSSYVPTSRTITINGTTQDLSANRSWSVGTVTGSGTATRVAFWDGSSSLSSNTNLYWDNTNSRLGVGLTNPQRALEVYSATADTHLRLSGAAPSVSMGEAITGSIYQAKFGLATANNQFVTGSVAGDFVINNQTGATIWAYNSTEKMRLDTNGNLGIGGIANSSYRLHVFGTAPILAIESNTTGNVTLRFLQTGFNVSGISYINSDSSLRFTNNNGALIFNTGLVNGALTLASAGAATFSSSVTASASTTTGFIAQTTANSVYPYFRWVANNRSYWSGAIDNGTDATWQLGNGNTVGSNTLMTVVASSGNVGIGTTSPSSISGYTILSLNNATNGGLLDLQQGGTSYGYIYAGPSYVNIQTVNSAYLQFQSGSTNTMRITSGGLVTIGNSSPASNATRLSLYSSTDTAFSSSLYCLNSSGVNTFIVRGDGAIFLNSFTYNTNTTVSAANMFIWSGYDLGRSTSSRVYKTEIEDVISADVIYKMRPVWYRSLCEKDRKDWSHYGFIAEEMAEIEPRFTHFDEQEDGTLVPNGVQYDRITALLVKALQDQKEIINDLRSELDELKAKIN